MKRLIPYPIRVEARRFERWLQDSRASTAFAEKRSEEPQNHPFLLAEHSSKLLRQVSPSLMPLQVNKTQNLRLACDRIDGLILEPSDVFSFCHLIGRTSWLRGYRKGLEMHEGKMIGAYGGGLCQLANMLFWMALHLNLEIVERHRHELDLFPDDERTVPFGLGASVFFNYVDLRFRNTLDQSLLLRLQVEPPLLRGAIYSNKERAFDVQIVETEHRFFRDMEGVVWRENRVERQTTFRNGRPPVHEEIAHHLARVCYEVPEERMSE